MDDFDQFTMTRMPTARRPLLGLTILVVEDSRYASEAMRLLCLKSGARIRRADCLTSGRRHLQIYRPSGVIVDCGLPDGSGIELIDELARATPRVGVLLATSGDTDVEATAMAAGADGFLPKPVSSLAAFQEAILSRIPSDRHPSGPRAVSEELIQPDRVAFDDDMAHAADILRDSEEDGSIDYLAQFLRGVANSADDTDLANAAQDLAKARTEGRAVRSDLARVAGLVQDRLAQRAVI